MLPFQTNTTGTFVAVILPLPLPKPYTYYVPEELLDQVQFGVRVEVQFGRSKRYSAIVVELLDQAPVDTHPKPILAVLDDAPVIHPRQWQHWQWLADYYVCTPGEVMHAALPAHLKLASETKLVLSPLYQDDLLGLSNDEYLIAEALTIQETITINDVRSILNRSSTYSIIKRLLDKKVIYLMEDIKERYQPKQVKCVRWHPDYVAHPELMSEAFDKTAKSERQTAALLAFISLEKKQDYIRQSDIYRLVPKVDSSVLKAMAKKDILEIYDRQVSRIGSYEEQTSAAKELSTQQSTAVQEIQQYWKEKRVVLLHGVTGSGKTRVYVELIQQAIEQGGQALYLLPEIALTAQIVARLQQVFGDAIGVYHSRMSNNERVELWRQVRAGRKIVLGARSALLLPFSDLRLIVVDEEHDASYKQQDPNPRYHARDAAIYLAGLHEAKVLLGTATPAVESYHNARQGKYGLVKMPERFGGIQMPEIQLANAREASQRKKMQSHFTPDLMELLKATIERGEQAILFQNRRGFAPTYRCGTCEWHSQCIHCDVSLTYHQYRKQLKCHYCGYSIALPVECPACGSKDLSLRGFGTEKIEDELKIFLPQARIGRMDLETVRGKNAHAKLIHQFEEGELDILVGTQMVTKGLDFEKVGVVGVISADQLLQFPDFRSNERGYQLIVQVSGRAGRKHRRGKVVVQSFNPAHPVLNNILDDDFDGFFDRELQDRRTFRYPPFVRLIKVTLKHKKPDVLQRATRVFDQEIKRHLGDWVLGPAPPNVARVRSYYLMDFLIKVPPNREKLHFSKSNIRAATDALHATDGLSGVRVAIDVDPQ